MVDEPGRWSRRIVRPQLSVTSDDPAAVVVELAAALQRHGFRVTPAADGFRARRWPWLDWLAGAVSGPCVLQVSSRDGIVHLDVERTGAHPAPERVAAAVGQALEGVRVRGVQVSCGTWQPASR